ncbi:DUF72 domain-containing protein [Calderihabitans maritimus]|uniref:DUF72 domain-containing protein n=1 Tax=Calderihabitans maritimus TaxID=1246530 RepID=A0A1Z5HR93_9FIRM|nr:DUF72 domain-containing protein [Calderihabitans maritimus]GAW92049.1 hypothetical protein Desgi_1034 [Calderihabitans maritimus]
MLFIGTAGYSYDDWIGPFYPPSIKQREMLPFYAREFSFTEVNSTFYRIPTKYMLYHMQEKTPPGFQFVIKAPKELTHEREDNQKSFRQFREALEPLIENKKLGCILAQFPYSFHCNKSNQDYLKKFREGLEELPVVVEFRHRGWIKKEVFNLMVEQQLGYVCVDQPQLGNLIPPVVWVTAPIGYVRFHGRNREKWWRYDYPHERYDYLYSEAELREWIPRIKKLFHKTSKTFISMNNHYQGKAITNARMLRRMLEETKVIPPDAKPFDKKESDRG